MTSLRLCSGAVIHISRAEARQRHEEGSVDQVCVHCGETYDYINVRAIRGSDASCTVGPRKSHSYELKERPPEIVVRGESCRMGPKTIIQNLLEIKYAQALVEAWLPNHAAFQCSST
jgi:hypothetical protein